MKTILQSHFNITNLHAFLKIFQSNAEKLWHMTNLHLSKGEISLFFIEIVDKETYLKYPVQKSKHIYSDDSTFFKRYCKEAFISGNLEDSHYVFRDKFVMSNNLKHK